MDNFALPMQQLVVELDTALPQFATHKKAADEAYPLLLLLPIIITSCASFDFTKIQRLCL